MPDAAHARAYLLRLALDMRAKAEEYRARAEGIRNRPAKEVLLGLAADTDKMAANIEARARTLGTAA
jgi:hypothetical protein